MRRVELLEVFRMLGANGAVAHVLAHHRAIFALHQSVVGGSVGPGFGELRQQLVQQFGHPVIQELRAVAAVEAQNAKGELMQHGLQDRRQVAFRDGLDAAHHFPLRHRIDRMDVVQPSLRTPDLHPQSGGIHGK